MKKFNNLFDSIIMTILSFFSIVLLLSTEIFGVIQNDNNEHKLVTSIIIFSTIGLASITSIIAILKHCYEYWGFDERGVYSKKPFCKKVFIEYRDIKKIEKKVVKALVLEIFKSEAIVIS